MVRVFFSSDARPWNGWIPAPPTPPRHDIYKYSTFSLDKFLTIKWGKGGEEEWAYIRLSSLLFHPHMWRNLFALESFPPPPSCFSCASTFPQKRRERENIREILREMQPKSPSAFGEGEGGELTEIRSNTIFLHKHFPRKFSSEELRFCYIRSSFSLCQVRADSNKSFLLLPTNRYHNWPFCLRPCFRKIFVFVPLFSFGTLRRRRRQQWQRGRGEGKSPLPSPPPSCGREMECGEFPTGKSAGFAKYKTKKFNCFDLPYVLPFFVV